MKAKLAFVAGLGAGYLVGTRVGRSGYDGIKNGAGALWQTDTVQEIATHLKESIKDEAKGFGSRLVHKATGHGTPAPDDAGQAGAAKDAAAKDVASKSNNHDALPDVESDPALNVVVGQDWADEGGALPHGPQQ